MKCNTCGYDLKEMDEYCPNCGTKVEKQQGLVCCYCHHKISEECNFCPTCGKEVIKDNSGCKYCGYSLKSDDVFCPNCGKKKENSTPGEESPKEGIYGVPLNSTIDETKQIEECKEDGMEDTSSIPMHEEIGGYTPVGNTTRLYVHETPNPYMVSTTNDSMEKSLKPNKSDDAPFWRNPIVWIISISLLVICLLLSQYMKENPSSISSKKETKTEQKVGEELDDIKITKDTSSTIMQINNNAGGQSYQFDDKLYLSVDGYIYEMNLDFSKPKKIVDETGEYIYVDAQYIYYCDESYNYQRVDRKSKKKETILENIYYPRVIDGMLYYQSDVDGETIHVYNLETKEDKKIGNEKSYAMIVDAKNNVIYYINQNNGISKINIDGTGNEVILEQGYMVNFIYEEGFIYYCDELGINKIDLATKNNELLLEKEGIVDISLVEDKIVYSGYNLGLYVVNKDGSDKKTITTNYIQGIEVQGDVIIYTDASKEAIYGATKDAKRNRIHKIEDTDRYEEDDSPDIDGIQEF